MRSYGGELSDVTGGRGFGRAWALASCGGYVDAVGFLTLFGLFTAHQSGNTTHGAVAVGLGEWAVAASQFVPVLAFVGGVVLGALIIERGNRSGQEVDAVGPALLLEVVLLVVFLIAGEGLVGADEVRSGSWGYYGLAIVAATAMGLQASSLRRIGELRVTTVFVTGMLVSIAEDSVRGWRLRRNGDASGASESARRVQLHGGVWTAYLIGGFAGAVLEQVLDFWALLLPITWLAFLARRRSIG